MTRKRSAYRPKPRLQDPLGYVLNGFKPASGAVDVIVAARAKNHLALKLACLGQATKQDVGTLAAAFNIAEAFAHLGVGNDWLPEIGVALSAVDAMSKRPKYIFTGPELTSVNLGMQVLDLQLDKVTVNQMEEALEIVRKVLALKRKAQK